MTSLEKRYEALKHNPNFEKLSVEFLIIKLAENIEYIVLVLTALGLIGFIDFNLNPSHFPALGISNEILHIKSLGYNPITIYGHFLYVFYLITKGFALGFFETVKTTSNYALIVVFLIANIWIAYSKLKYGYDNKSSKGHNVFLEMLKNYLFSSNFIERSLWMLFFVDLMVFLTTPSKDEVYFLLAIYGLILSVKLIPWFSRVVVELSKTLEKTFLSNKRVQIAVAIVDVVLVYFDSSGMFTLLAMVLTYNAVAQLTFKAFRSAKPVLKVFYYIFNAGIFVFFGSIIAIYLISYAVVLIVQSPLIAFYYYKKKRFLPAWIMEVVNCIILVFLLRNVIF
ncbi:hypothetical protein COV19_03330 [Candidatus Woesearchaeota archaeon CG10_big_fil_rev_8_21_14_0_10_44_13]|nr:MAG: hypothetical protein COV19_03330 [Candidatus Woesearchaeota archaeon CG10_big_fil_rev_8_21_14_0_10_44_13]